MPNDLSERPANLVEALAACLAAVPGLPVDLAAPPAGEPQPPVARALPVLRWLDAIVARAPAAARPLAAALAELSPTLEWRQTYGAHEAPPGFLENYGWTELAGARGLFRDPAVSQGFLLLGPHTHYPAHHHPALEHYVPLSGDADWFDEDRGWRAEPPLNLIVHRPGVSHAMRTADAPLLAWFHWSGEGVGVSARMG